MQRRVALTEAMALAMTTTRKPVSSAQPSQLQGRPAP